ncbi:hypothetical protein GGQ98_001630 [Sphingosinicella soli]|uniref:Uncharacterized protein n=1 Tax=Sphingosinicella soli TaxID=333708 RepID=A0A7W7B2R0_9SPHN|nr:hypothetical protein [Sphingosinicella soli]
MLGATGSPVSAHFMEPGSTEIGCTDPSTTTA